MLLIRRAQVESVRRHAGVFAGSFIPSDIVFGPYDGPLDIATKTSDEKNLRYLLEVSKHAMGGVGYSQNHAFTRTRFFEARLYGWVDGWTDEQ